MCMYIYIYTHYPGPSPPNSWVSRKKMISFAAKLVPNDQQPTDVSSMEYQMFIGYPLVI